MSDNVYPRARSFQVKFNFASGPVVKSFAFAPRRPSSRASAEADARAFAHLVRQHKGAPPEPDPPMRDEAPFTTLRPLLERYRDEPKHSGNRDGKESISRKLH